MRVVTKAGEFIALKYDNTKEFFCLSEDIFKEIFVKIKEDNDEV